MDPGEFTLASDPAPVVRTVENPSILALSFHCFGLGCPPLVCTSGRPNSGRPPFSQTTAPWRHPPRSPAHHTT
ncbi:DUF2399 domain-containing protein [Streptomyces sp. NPDC001709]